MTSWSACRCRASSSRRSARTRRMTFQAPLLLVCSARRCRWSRRLYARRPSGGARKFAVRFTNVDLLIAVAGRSSARHVPAVLALLALAPRCSSRSRGRSATVAAERREATVHARVRHVAARCSATDVQPSRLAAAQARGQRRSSDAVPDEFRIGVIGLRLEPPSSSTEPTTDHARVKATIELAAGRRRDRDGRRAEARDQLGAGAGPGRARRRAAAAGGDRAARRRRQRPAARTRSTVVQDTKKYKIPVYTVALGTPERHAHPHRPEHRALTNTERGPAGPADAAGHRARHGRPVLRDRRRATSSPPSTATSARG